MRHRTKLDYALHKSRSWRYWGIMWRGFAWAFCHKANEFAMWSIWKDFNIHELPVADAITDIAHELHLTRMRARQMLFDNAAGLWEINQRVVTTNHLSKVKRLARGRIGYWYHGPDYVVPYAIYRENLVTRAAFTTFFAQARDSGQVTTRRYTQKLTGLSLDTLSRYRKILKNWSYLRSARFDQRVTRKLPRARNLTEPMTQDRDPRWGRNYYLGWDGVWRRYLGDRLYLDECRIWWPGTRSKIFPSHNKGDSLSYAQRMCRTSVRKAPRAPQPASGREGKRFTPTWENTAERKGVRLRRLAAQHVSLWESLASARSDAPRWTKGNRYSHAQRVTKLLGKRAIENAYAEAEFEESTPVDILRGHLASGAKRLYEAGQRLAEQGDRERHTLRQHSDKCYWAQRGIKLPPTDLSALAVFPQLSFTATELLRRELNGHDISGILFAAPTIGPDISI